MSFLGKDEDLRAKIGRRLRVFREAIMKRQKTTYAEFAAKVDIPMGRFKSFEEGLLFPEIEEMVSLRRIFGLNINWLFGNRGDLFCFMVSDKEEKFNKLSVQACNDVELNLFKQKKCGEKKYDYNQQ